MPDRVIRKQFRWSSSLAATIALTYVAVAFASRSDAFAAQILHRQEARWERTNSLYQEHVGFLDAEDKILLRDVPLAGFSLGGTYLLGSSTMQHAAIPWQWPAEMQAHLWAIKSANYKEQFQFVRFLAESEGWLSAGGEKTTVILGLSHLDARMKLPGTVDSDFVPALFARHNLYRYDPEAGMSRQPISPTVFHARRERLTLYQFLKSAWNEYLGSHQSVHERRQGTPDDDSKAREFLARQLGGDDWQAAQQHQLGELALMIDYLKERRVRIGAVLLPIKSWNDNQPFADEFARRVKEIVHARGIELLDLSHAVPDAEYYDDTHLSFRGQKRIDSNIRKFVNGLGQ